MALTLGACGGDDSDSGAAADGAGETGSGLEQSSIDYTLKYTGGKAGKADSSLSPVTVGFVNQQGGVPAYPENEAAADAVVSLVNEKLGGIGGHPLKLEKCFVLSEEDGQKCGSQMANAKLPIVMQETITVGNDSYHKTLGTEIPNIVTNSTQASDFSSKNSHDISGGGQALLNGMVQDVKNQGAKTVAILGVNNPAGDYTVKQILIPGLKAVGISYKTAYHGDSVTTPEMAAALQSAGASKADAIMTIPSQPAQCVSTYDAMKQLGIDKPVVTSLTCNADEFVDHTGAGPEGWDQWAFATNPRITTDEASKVYNNVMTAYGKGKFATVNSAVSAFGNTLTVVQLANAVGPDNLSPATLNKAIAAFRGPAFMTPGEMHCVPGPDPNFPTVCGDTAAGSTFKDGKWQLLPPVQRVIEK
jgi:branched-chain amino acid transport system substrate-binding protein